MSRFTMRSFEQILTQMVSTVVTRSDLSDISDASHWKHLLAAAARSDNELHYQIYLLLKLFSIDTAEGDDLDERAKDIQPALISRSLGVKARGNIVISRTGTTGTVVLPIGIRVKTSSGITMTTTAASSITASSPEVISGHGVGRDSPLIPAIAEEYGVAGNVIANTLTRFVSKPVGVDEVTNPSVFAYGVDQESDDAFRGRLKDYIASLSNTTVHACESKILGAEDEDTGATILYSKCVEDQTALGNFTVYIDDGTGYASTSEAVSSENVTAGLAGPPADSAVGGEEYPFLDYKPVNSSLAFTLTSSTRGALIEDTDYYLNPASGQINFITALTAGEVITADYTRYTGLIALAQKILDGDAADRVNYPGVRAAGVRCTVSVPQIQIQNVTVNVTISEGYNQTTVRAAVLTAIRDYINTSTISADLLRSALFKLIMDVPGVYNCNIILPANDVILLDDQLARTTDNNITVT